MRTGSQQPSARRWVLPFLAALIAALAAILAATSASASAAGTAETRVRASAAVVEVPVGPPEHIAAGQRLGEAGPRAVGVVATGVAAETVPEATHVLKGPIADAVPKNLPEQMALDAAKQGAGRQIMDNLADAPRLIANYGQGTWVKMQYVLRGNYSNVTVHYFRNLDTGLDVEFKFK